MTTEEKRSEVWDICNSYGHCDKCPLRIGGWDVPLHRNKDNSCPLISKATEKDLDRALALAGGYSNCIKPTENDVIKPNDDVNENANEPVDLVNHPPHYTHGGMECIDEMILIFGKEAVMNFCLCNAWKYRKRAPYKGTPEQDMDKSNWYLNKYKELKEGA